MRTRFLFNHEVFLVLFSLLLALLGAEYVVRLLGIAPRYYFFQVKGADATFRLSDNPILGYEMIPNLRNSSYDCHNSFPFTNSLGFRDTERSLELSGAAKRLIMLGDSVVAGHGLCETEKTISGQLERISNGKLEVLNFGVGGYCTRAEIELLETRGLGYKPDTVILLFVENDYVNSNGTIINSLSQSSLAPLRERLLSSSALFRLAGARLEHLLRSSNLRQNAEAIGSDNVEKGLIKFAALAKAHNFSAVVVTWPYFSDTQILEPKKLFSNRSSPLKSVHQIAAEVNIPIIELAHYFRRDFMGKKKKTRTSNRKASPRWIYTQGDGTHPNEHAAQLAAEFVKRKIL